jgi:methionyl-tRNA formyltransferase
MKKNTLLIGRGNLAIECMRAMKKTGSPPAAVICDPRDEGRDTWIKSLFGACLKAGYIEGENVFRTGRVNDKLFVMKLKKKFPGIDYIFSVQTRSILHDEFIALAGKYVYNLHLAPLPKLRGVHPSSWAILDGLTTMGVTIHLIESERIDAGPIVFQNLFPVTKNDTVWTLYKKCGRAGAKLLHDKMEKLLASNIKLKPQDESRATYHSLKELNYADSQVPRDLDVEQTLRYIRSRIFPPLQLPYFIYQGKNIYIEAAGGRKTNKIPPAAGRRGRTYIIPCTNGVITVSKYKYQI